MNYLSIFSSLLQEALALHRIDWVVTVTALVYVVLAARQNVWCWVWGIISCSLWAYASFTFYHLWLDALLQIFYVVMGFVGLYNWRRSDLEHKGRSDSETEGRGEAAKLLITKLTLQQNLFILIGGSILSLLFGYFFDIYTPAAATYLDAFVTVFSIITTFILVQKKLDNWAYWVIIDGVSVYLFASRGAYLFAFIMIIYILIAANAFLQWKREMLRTIGDY
jgi:nicotinamide mononucleotide transporter